MLGWWLGLGERERERVGVGVDDGYGEGGKRVVVAWFSLRGGIFRFWDGFVLVYCPCAFVRNIHGVKVRWVGFIARMASNRET